jgi:hypothetical protein
MILLNVNLYIITCMKKFEDIIQVTFGLGLHCRTIVDVLYLLQWPQGRGIKHLLQFYSALEAFTPINLSYKCLSPLQFSTRVQGQITIGCLIATFGAHLS